MAFRNTGFPPSTAPVHIPAVTPKPRRPMPFAKSAPVRSFAVAPIASGVILFAAAMLPGYATFAATESLALGILAADILFLLAIAAWSTVSGR